MRLGRSTHKKSVSVTLTVAVAVTETVVDGVVVTVVDCWLSMHVQIWPMTAEAEERMLLHLSTVVDATEVVLDFIVVLDVVLAVVLVALEDGASDSAC